MNPRLLAVAGTAAAAILLGGVAAGAYATDPGSEGRIAFSRYRLVNEPRTAELFVVNSDGSGKRQLTHGRPGYVDEQPDWSPTGSRIVFTRCPPHGGACGIWSVRDDGSDPKRLSPSCPAGGTVPRCVDDGAPVYSPDGRQIAFFRFTGKTAALMIADAELKHPRAVALGDKPGWSPTGKQLAFERFNDPGTHLKPAGSRAVFVVDTDGKPLRRLQPWSVVARLGKGLRRITAWKPPSGDNPDWSPDGQRILFRTMPNSEDIQHSKGNLFTVRPDGTGIRQVTHFSSRTRILQNGSYSRDGESIVFTTNAVATNRPRGKADLYVMQADGTHMRRLTHSPNWEDSPDWGQ